MLAPISKIVLLTAVVDAKVWHGGKQDTVDPVEQQIGLTTAQTTEMATVFAACLKHEKYKTWATAHQDITGSEQTPENAKKMAQV